MADETKIGQLVIDLQIRTQALEKGLETAQKKLKEIEKSNEQVKNSNSGLEMSYIALAATATVSLVKITGALTDSVKEYTKYKNSMMTVNKVAQNTGNTLEDIQKIINKSNQFKLMDETDLNASIKNLLLYGYTAEQATDILNRLQDSAVGNRQEHYNLSEAVRVTTEGIRMENSVTSDAAGVQKNIAKMYEEHAKSISKKTDSLTQAEKAQAVYNGIMAETEAVVGSASEVASQYEGAEAQKNAELLKTKQLLGESLIPTYAELTGVQKTGLSILNELIKNNKSATSGIITFTAVLLASSIAVGATTKGIKLYKESTLASTIATQGLTTAVLANPIFMGTIGISATIALLNAFNTAMQESINKMQENTEKAKNTSELIKSFQENNFTYTEQESVQAQNIVDETQKIIESYEERKNKIQDIQNKIDDINNRDLSGNNPQLQYLQMQLQGATDGLKKFEEENLAGANNVDKLKKRIDTLNKTLQINSEKQKYSTLIDAKSTRQKLVNIAQTQADIEGKKKLLNILKQGKTTTDEYADAKSQLVKVYPELAKVNENTIASTEKSINAEEVATQAKWANAQIVIQASILEAQAMASNSEQIIRIAIATQQSVEQVTASLQNQISVLSNLAQLSPADFKGSIDTTTYRPKVSKSSKSYQNKALDNYKKQIEYKKSLDQISLRDEINMYETALRRYAKTQDEKMEITTKLYELRKELTEKTLDDYTSQIDYEKQMGYISAQQEIERYEHAYRTYAKTFEQKRDLELKLHDLREQLAEETTQMLKEQADKEREILNQKTEDYKKYIQDQKNLRGAEYDIKEQEADLNKIIEMHRNYLNQIMKDERYSLDERQNIYREEIDIIRDYEQQKRDARVQSVNDTVNQLKSAITKQLEEIQKADEEAIKKNMELVEEWKNTRIDAINEEYDARIKAIQDELDALDKAEDQKSRDEEDAEYEKKKTRLQSLIEYEHDATTKANYQKQLDKLVAEHQKELDKRVLQDKKEALKEQQDLLKEEQQNKTEVIKEEAEKQKEQYQTQLDNLKEYYEKQKEIAQETAEKMILNVEQNQEQILNLLNKYGDKYELTGQSLGEKLAQGINNSLSNKIQGIIQTIQDRIDGAIENQISKWTSSVYKYEQATAKATQAKNISTTQNIYIEQNPEMPSETYRKYRNISEELASDLAGM